MTRARNYGSRWRLGMRSHSRLAHYGHHEAILPREAILLAGRAELVVRSRLCTNVDLVIVVQALDGEAISVDALCALAVISGCKQVHLCQVVLH